MIFFTCQLGPHDPRMRFFDRYYEGAARNAKKKKKNCRVPSRCRREGGSLGREGPRCLKWESWLAPSVVRGNQNININLVALQLSSAPIINAHDPFIMHSINIPQIPKSYAICIMPIFFQGWNKNVPTLLVVSYSVTCAE